MRIALVIERMDCHRGGRETSTAEVAAELLRRGHAVTVLCQQGSWHHEGVDVRALGRRGLSRRATLRAFTADVAREIAGGAFDVVHTMLPLPGADVYQLRGGTVPGQRAASLRRRSGLGAMAARLAGPLNRHREAMAELERDVVADESIALLPVSELVADELAEAYGRRANVHVVPNGVSLPDVSDEQRAEWRRAGRIRLDVGPSDVVFMTVATNFELKGVRQAIRAFARWRQAVGQAAAGRLVVVGRDPVQVDSYQRAATLGRVAGWVHFEPPTDDIFRLYAVADVCVLLSWYDPCSRVVLEATRWKIPSITTAFNGASELLAGAGHVVATPNDLRGIAEAMVALTDASVRQACQAACEAVADDLSMARHVDRLIEIYESVRRRR